MLSPAVLPAAWEAEAHIASQENLQRQPDGTCHAEENTSLAET